MADSIVLPSGKILQGEIVAQTTRTLEFRTPMGTFSFPRNQVRVLENTNKAEPGDLVRAFESALSAGEIARAADLLRNMVFQGATDRSRIETALARYCDRQKSGQGREHASYLLSAIDDYLTRHELSGLILVKLCALAFDTSDTSRAVSLMQRVLQPSVWNATPQTAREEVTILLEKLIETPQMDVSSLDHLTDSLVGFAASDTRERRVYVLAERSLVRKQIDSGHFAEAIDHLFARGHNLDAAIFCQLLRETFERAQSSETTRTLLALYERATTLARQHAPQADVHDLLRNYFHLLLAAGAFDRADQVLKMWDAVYPDLVAELSLELEFDRRKQKLNPEDDMGRYRLAKWALRMGLTDKARKEFQRLTRSADCGRAAQLQLDMLRAQEEAQLLTRARELFQKGYYSSAAQLAEELTRRRPTSRFTTEALLLVSLARYRERLSPDIQRQKALSLIQQAERSALRGEFASADALLQEAVLACPDDETRREINKLRTRFPKLELARSATETQPIPEPNSSP